MGNISAGVLSNIVQNLPYQNILVEAALGVALERIVSGMTTEQRDEIIRLLDEEKVEEAAERIQEMDGETPETDLQKEVENLCRELDECEIPNSGEATELIRLDEFQSTVQAELDDFH